MTTSNLAVTAAEEGVMPREQVHHPRINTHDAGTPNERHVAEDGIYTHVGWNRAGWVQVSLSLSRTRLQELAKGYEGYTSDEASLFSEVLTREEINKMINTLRKARDQAYGKDA